MTKRLFRTCLENEALLNHHQIINYTQMGGIKWGNKMGGIK